MSDGTNTLWNTKHVTLPTVRVQTAHSCQIPTLFLSGFPFFSTFRHIHKLYAHTHTNTNSVLTHSLAPVCLRLGYKNRIKCTVLWEIKGLYEERYLVCLNLHTHSHFTTVLPPRTDIHTNTASPKGHKHTCMTFGLVQTHTQSQTTPPWNTHVQQKITPIFHSLKNTHLHTWLLSAGIFPWC